MAKYHNFECSIIHLLHKRAPLFEKLNFSLRHLILVVRIILTGVNQVENKNFHNVLGELTTALDDLGTSF